MKADQLDEVLGFYRAAHRQVARYSIVMMYDWKDIGVFIDGLEYEDAVIEADRLTQEFRDDGRTGAWGNLLCTPKLMNSADARCHLSMEINKRWKKGHDCRNTPLA